MLTEPEKMDAAWFNEALAKNPALDGAGNVTGAHFEGFVGTGQIGRTGRYSLTWDGEGGPESVVVKFPTANMDIRVPLFGSGLYHSELGFYSDIAPTLDVSTPRCLFSEINDEQLNFALVLEDLRDSVVPDQLKGVDISIVELAVDQAVGMHAPRWGDESLKTAPALNTHSEGKSFAERGEAGYAMTFEACIARLGEHLEPEIIQVIRDCAPLIRTWGEMATGTPHTVVHGDFRPDNFMLGTTPTSPKIAVVDWQTVFCGLGAADVAYLVAGSLDVDLRREVEGDLLERYRQGLIARGIEYSAADAKRDYAWGSLMGLEVAVTATVMAAQTERGDRLFSSMLTRHGHQALDLGALELVAAAV